MELFEVLYSFPTKLSQDINNVVLLGFLFFEEILQFDVEGYFSWEKHESAEIEASEQNHFVQEHLNLALVLDMSKLDNEGIIVS